VTRAEAGRWLRRIAGSGLLLSASAGALAQSPAPESGADLAPETVIRVRTSEVLIPTLVEDRKSGQTVYGLGPGDFAVYDDGVPQRIHVDDDLDTAPVSVVVAIETGRSGLLEFNKINRLGSLIDLFLGDGQSEVALVAFDSRPRLVSDFSGSDDTVRHALNRLQPGDGGAAIYDAVGYSLELLEARPENHRRVLLLISETRDHGSHEVNAADVVKAVGISNTLVASLAFSPGRDEFVHDLGSNGGGGQYANLLTPLLMAINAARHNVAREIAEMSGGEYAPFAKERTFEKRVSAISRHARNRYLLSFTPQDQTPGLHTLDVRVVRNIDAEVIARANYWSQPPQTVDGDAGK
jgi:VWFA-related protein